MPRAIESFVNFALNKYQSPLDRPNSVQTPVAYLLLLRTIIVVIVVISPFLYVFLKVTHLFGYPAASV